jgi:hypothetical protein
MEWWGRWTSPQGVDALLLYCVTLSDNFAKIGDGRLGGDLATAKQLFREVADVVWGVRAGSL